MPYYGKTVLIFQSDKEMLSKDDFEANVSPPRPFPNTNPSLEGIKQVYIQVEDTRAFRADVIRATTGEMLAKDATNRWWVLLPGTDERRCWIAVLKETGPLADLPVASVTVTNRVLEHFPKHEFFSDIYEIQATLYSTRLIFGRRHNDTGGHKTDVALTMSPSQAKDLMADLANIVVKYEANFGRIPCDKPVEHIKVGPPSGKPPSVLN